MNRFFRMAAGAAFSTGLTTTAFADTIKVGVVAPFSGPFAICGKQFQEAIETYVALNGTTAGEH